MAFNIEDREMYPIFDFAMCFWSIHSKLVRLGKHANSKQKSQSHTTSAVSRQVYVHALLVQHLLSAFFKYLVRYGPTSEAVWILIRQKNWLKYNAFTELNKITSKIYSSCSNYSYLFWSPSKFVAVRFVWLKKIYSYLYQCAAHSTFYSIVDFSKEKGKNGFLVVFFKWAFSKKPGCFLGVGSNYINPGLRTCCNLPWRDLTRNKPCSEQTLLTWSLGRHGWLHHITSTCIAQGWWKTVLWRFVLTYLLYSNYSASVEIEAPSDVTFFATSAHTIRLFHTFETFNGCWKALTLLLSFRAEVSPDWALLSSFLRWFKLARTWDYYLPEFYHFRLLANRFHVRFTASLRHVQF